MPEIITRAEAKARGLPRFYTGKPCGHGHVCEHRVSDGKCIECERERDRRRSKKVCERKRRRYQNANADKIREREINRQQRERQQQQRKAEIDHRRQQCEHERQQREHERQQHEAKLERNRQLREEAKAAGLKRYFTGEPCDHGHVAERTVVDGKCVECKRERERRWRAENVEKARKRGRRTYRNTDPEKIRAKERQQYWKNPEKARAKRHRYRELNPDYNRRYYQRNREYLIEQAREWHAAKPDYMRQYIRKRYASDPEFRDRVLLRSYIHRITRGTPGEGKLRHVPPGRVEAVRAKLEADLAARVDAPTDNLDDLDRREWQVDHIVPISRMRPLLSEDPRPVQAYVASHPDLIQLLTQAENAAKSNRIDGISEADWERFWAVVDEARAYHGIDR